MAEAIDQIDAYHVACFFGKRKRHAAAPASRVEDVPAHVHAGLFQHAKDLGAAVVLEKRVVVFRAEPAGGVQLDGFIIDPAHQGLHCRGTRAWAPPRREWRMCDPARPHLALSILP
jgi:hypothetical protein